MATRDFHGGALLLMPLPTRIGGSFASQSDGCLPKSMARASNALTCRRDFVTDLASVPSYLWSVLQKTGRYGNAAIYHDWLYWEQSVPRSFADRVFDRAMHDMGVDASTRRLMWAGVRVFGGSYWEQNKLAKAVANDGFWRSS